MRIEPILSKLKQEKAQYFQASSMSDRGRYYILHNLIDVFNKLYEGYDDEKLKKIQVTLAQIKISDEQNLGEFLKKPATPSELYFKIPVFPISFNAEENGKHDLLVQLYSQILQSSGHWLENLSKDEIKQLTSVPKWQKQLIINSKMNEHRVAHFADTSVTFMNRSCSSKSALDINSRIQDYISKCSLPHEAKLSAFHFICRTGGSEMCELLDEILSDKFKDAAQWRAEKGRSVNWTFDSNKNPICNSMLSVEIQSLKSKKESQLHISEKIHHDPRLIKMNFDTDRPEPDLLIMSNTELSWAQDTIIPIVNSVSISSQNNKIKFS